MLSITQMQFRSNLKRESKKAKFKWSNYSYIILRREGGGAITEEKGELNFFKMGTKT